RRPVRACPAGSLVILANAWIVTMDDAGTEHERGWLRIEDGLIAELGAGDPPAAGNARMSPPRVGSEPPATRQDPRPGDGPSATRPWQQEGEFFDLGGAVVTPGLVNTHHHLFQTLTRALAQQADLFTWLRELYPVWAHIDDEMEYAAARTGLAEL